MKSKQLKHKWFEGSPLFYPCVAFVEYYRKNDGIFILKDEGDFKDLEIEDVKWVPLPIEYARRIKKEKI